MEPRHAKTYERTIPANGDNGGPLCCIVAKYEDGTQISFGHEVMNKYVPADLVRESVEAVTEYFDARNLDESVKAKKRLESALAALKAMEG